ncbi:hypothetical protein GALMADRAFT_220356 [Galerina marginata CBS 339.88]|uniref:F-box domain-containing protein n=1 Tax=Galerina marginata (strain CBS 339.88) TaxID=685588 RepID=A0A067TJ31_GALM3|nr:hypothetical protein GALMADRAFT_220356 [Galerina marginata CBS 339.88]
MDGPVRSPISIPPEICGIICQDPAIRYRDLHTFCSVSQAFRSEAERLLYITIRLRGTRCIKAFCTTVARRPYLALRLKKLILYMPPQMDLEADDLSRIMHAFSLSVNLKDLQILKDDTRGIGDKPGDAVQRWILEGHRFRLRRFTNSYFQPQVLVDFLKNQPAIDTLVLKCKGNAEICAAPLPMLSTLDSSAAVVQEFSYPSWHKRNIKRLQFEFVQSTDVQELATFVALTQYNKSLKSLSIRRKDSRNGLDIAVLTACVASQLPDIKYLRIMDYTTKLETYHVPFLPFPIRLNHIETLVLRPPTRAYDDTDKDSKISAYMELRTPEGRKCAAERITTALPTLTRLVIVGKHIHEFRKNLETGVISEQELKALDDQDWMKVS